MKYEIDIDYDVYIVCIFREDKYEYMQFNDVYTELLDVYLLTLNGLNG